MGPKKGGGNRGASAKNIITTVPDSEYIVFGNGKKDKKPKKSTNDTNEDTSGPAKPTVKQIIGGASWTGKLPVNLLSEHCQRQKWNKPDYDMRTSTGPDGVQKMYRSTVSLSRTDPKTRETVSIPHMRLPPEHLQLSDRPSALEARHFAATYTLFRVSSMKNIHMTLPPDYRDLWKGELTRLKKEDVDQGRSWKYDEDPFAAEAKRKEILQKIEKDQKIKQQEKEKAAAEPASTSIPLRGKGDIASWSKVPKIEMGQQIRSEIEAIVRQNAVWNPYGIKVGPQDRKRILDDITKLGFRRAHIEEALEFCKDAEEALEWLLIHVPEDDLPVWAMPAHYSAGITLASSDLLTEAKVKKLALGGFPTDACVTQLRKYGGDESLAARALQAILVPELTPDLEQPASDSSEWDEELVTLEAIFAEKYCAPSKDECAISAEGIDGTQFTIRVRRPPQGYPVSQVPTVAVEADTLPAYIRLSAARLATLHAQDNFLGEVMIYNICQWVESALPDIIEHPGKLTQLHALLSTGNSTTSEGQSLDDYSQTYTRRLRREARQQHGDTRSNQELFDSQQARMATPEQVKMISARQKLPAWSKTQRILESISKHRVTIISGETGSGKSTQTVQFVLDDAIATLHGSSTRILCTQPRRVATLSLADRVSAERCSKVGDEVGYMIRGESRTSSKTKITFMTTGVLLRQLQNAGKSNDNFKDVSHIFIDEVHERSVDTDFLLALIKDILQTNTKLKIVLMSATLDADVFSQYFGGPSKVGLVEIEGRTFPVTDLFLDDVVSVTRSESSQQADDMGKTIQSLGKGINYDLIRDLVRYIDSELGTESGSVLIFLPGALEIDRCIRTVNALSNITALPLHASLPPAEQRKVFQRPPQGKRKVIAATNVAETSITIEDVVAVIDTGKVKETSFDAISNIVRLEEVWASKAACKQRRGRAGRVRAGICYKLFTRNTEASMPSKLLPEIQRVPLEQLCLSVKATGTGRDVAQFLSRTLTPPDSGAVSTALRNLHIMGAMEDNCLTALGQYLSLIAADLRCAKLMVYGTLFGCLEPCLTIASIINMRSPFVSPREKREEANEARATFPSTHGDLLLDMAAFEEWTNISDQLRSREMNEWCTARYLSQQTLRDISSTRRQLLDSLKLAGLIPVDYSSPYTTSPTINDHSQCLLLRALIAGALQPQIAQIQFPSKKYISSVSGAKELDPEAKTIKFFIPDEASAQDLDDKSKGTGGLQVKTTMTASSIDHTQRQSIRPMRTFIHPSSILFTAQHFSHHAQYLSFFTKVLTTKLYIRDITPLNVYSLLLFGGQLELDATGLGVTVGQTWKIQGWTRIGVLVNRLRVLLDQELQLAIEGGNQNSSHTDTLMGKMKNSKVVTVVKRLIELNGQDR